MSFKTQGSSQGASVSDSKGNLSQSPQNGDGSKRTPLLKVAGGQTSQNAGTSKSQIPAQQPSLKQLTQSQLNQLQNLLKKTTDNEIQKVKENIIKSITGLTELSELIIKVYHHSKQVEKQQQSLSTTSSMTQRQAEKQKKQMIDITKNYKTIREAIDVLEKKMYGENKGFGGMITAFSKFVATIKGRRTLEQSLTQILDRAFGYKPDQKKIPSSEGLLEQLFKNIQNSTPTQTIS